jgi:hypothetical protein
MSGRKHSRPDTKLKPIWVKKQGFSCAYTKRPLVNVLHLPFTPCSRSRYGEICRDAASFRQKQGRQQSVLNLAVYNPETKPVLFPTCFRTLLNYALDCFLVHSKQPWIIGQTNGRICRNSKLVVLETCRFRCFFVLENRVWH